MKNKGITLVALIITIIMLLILAGITIGQLTGNGIFENAKEAKEKYENAKQDEETQIAQYANDINSYVNGTRTEPTVKQEDKGYFNFREGNVCGFTTTKGVFQNNSLGLIPTTYATVSGDEMIFELPLRCSIEKELETTISSNDNFEISTEISFDNRELSYFGGILITLCQKNGNEYNKVASLEVTDYWKGYNGLLFTADISDLEIAFGSKDNTLYNASGRYALVGDGEKIYFYRDNILLGSEDYTDGISIDKVEISFFSNTKDGVLPPPMILKDLYVGQPRFYTSLIGE